MKRRIGTVAAMVLVLALTACGEQGTGAGTDAQVQEQQKTEERIRLLGKKKKRQKIKLHRMMPEQMEKKRKKNCGKRQKISVRLKCTAAMKMQQDLSQHWQLFRT